MEKIFETEVYKEVDKLAKQQGFTMKLFTFDHDSDYGKEANGIHKFDYQNKIIGIGVVETLHDQIGIYIHELLHAKLALTGYSKVKAYMSINPVVDSAMLEVENIAHHTLIYQEMKLLGYEHDDMNKKYVMKVVEETNKEFQGGSEINRALRILEAYYRIPNMIDEIENDIRRNQPKSYTLYKFFRKHMDKISNQQSMRKAIVTIIKYIDSYVKKELGNDMFLRYLNALTPYFTDSELKQRASNILKAVKLNEFEHVFLIKRKEDYSCYYLTLDLDSTRSFLEELTTHELLNKFGLSAYKKE